MRWIVSSSVKFRLLAIFIGAAMMFFGAQQLRDMPMDAFPEFAPPRVEIQTICLGPERRRGRVARERPARAVAQRPRRAAPRPLQVRAAAVVDRAPVRAGHRHPARAAAGAGARHVGHAVAADLGGAAGHHPADVDDGPRHEDRRLLEHDVDPAPVDDRLLEDQGAAAAGSRRRQRRDLGRAPGAVPRARRPQPHERARGSRSSS